MSGPHCYCDGECRVTNCKDCGKPIPEADKRRILHDLCMACRAATMPRRKLRFAPGDRVTAVADRDSYPQHAFTGTVEGWVGRELIGIRDDGGEWYRQPSDLAALPQVEQGALW